MPRSTVINTIERIRRQLASSLRYEVSILGSLAVPTDNVITLGVDLPAGVREGALLSVGTELMRVLAANVPTKEVTVFRGWQDTDAQLHPTGTEVWINPRFTAADIFEAMIDELNAWPPDLFRVMDATTSLSLGAGTYELPLLFKDAVGIVDVRFHRTTGWQVEGDVFMNTAWPRLDFRFQRGTATGFGAAPTSGLFLRLINESGPGSLYVQVAMPFNTEAITETADLVTDVGLAPSMLDVLTFGVKWRLMGDQNHARSQRGVADEPRRAEEVPINAALMDAQSIQAVYIRRRSEEMNRLRAMYPVRM